MADMEDADLQFEKNAQEIAALMHQLREEQDRKRHTPDVRRAAEPPPGLAEFEQHVMASDAPAVVLVDRALVRALLRYVRRLERDVAEGNFW